MDSEYGVVNPAPKLCVNVHVRKKNSELLLKTCRDESIRDVKGV